jgi:hypothetical protein
MLNKIKKFLTGDFNPLAIFGIKKTVLPTVEEVKLSWANSQDNPKYGTNDCECDDCHDEINEIDETLTGNVPSAADVANTSSMFDEVIRVPKVDVKKPAKKAKDPVVVAVEPVKKPAKKAKEPVVVAVEPVKKPAKKAKTPVVEKKVEVAIVKPVEKKPAKKPAKKVKNG